MAYKKVYVHKTISVNVEGKVRSLSFQWEDGRVYEIDRVMDKRPVTSTKVGGCGVRYTVRIFGIEKYVFQEDGKWFMEGKA